MKDADLKQFSTSSSSDDDGFTPQMALCLAAITLVGADGKFQDRELEKLRDLVRSYETAFLKAFNFYNDRPIDVCMKVVAARLNNEQKKAALKIMHELAHADKEFEHQEEKMLNKYAKAFGLSNDFV